MNATALIQVFIFLPVIGFVFSLLIPRNAEMWLSRIAIFTSGLNLLGFLFFLIYRASLNIPEVNLEQFTLYETTGYVFIADFYLDRIGAVFLFVGSLLTFMITLYSRYYMHREEGYKRFFCTILFFYAGYNFAILSGNFETLFIGWEILGISSFLLIAFYRDRYLPVRNAVKVFSIYRIADVGILLAMWASHHLWHESVAFIDLKNAALVHEHLIGHSAIGIFISMMILLTAMAKSAQLPFSSWLPRAMEGPTPSSAIFYGSLSVHLGVFLLLRTAPFWEQQYLVRVLIGTVGALTAIVTFLISRVQSNIKSKIAYASITQIGLIFIEISLGLETIALIHFAGNAFLRTYQLLVSPSLVSYLIRDQFYHFKPRRNTLFRIGLPPRLESSIYLHALREWNLDYLMNRIVFNPFKRIGHRLDFLRMKNIFFFVIPLYLVGLVALQFQSEIPVALAQIIPEILALVGLTMVLKAFSERRFARLAIALVLLNHCWIALAVSFNEHFDFSHTAMYLGGVIVSGLVGYICIEILLKKEGPLDLNGYYGHHYEHPRLAFIFLIACLGLMGFPISTTFIGEDLIFSHIHEDQYVLAIANALSFVLGGIALIRIYARLFLGPHIKTNHETPLHSS